MPGPDPPSEHYWTFGVRMDWRTPNLRLYVSDPLQNPISHRFHPSFSAHSWKKGYHRLYIVALHWFPHT